ncbi:MAG: hypothetical protein AAGA03_01240, partial [Planctomycetota bacterium]
LVAGSSVILVVSQRGKNARVARPGTGYLPPRQLGQAGRRRSTEERASREAVMVAGNQGLNENGQKPLARFLPVVKCWCSETLLMPDH